MNRQEFDAKNTLIEAHNLLSNGYGRSALKLIKKLMEQFPEHANNSRVVQFHNFLEQGNDKQALQILDELFGYYSEKMDDYELDSINAAGGAKRNNDNSLKQPNSIEAAKQVQNFNKEFAATEQKTK